MALSLAADRAGRLGRVSDPVFDVPRERELASGHGSTSLALLRRRDFRTLYLAVSTSELGDALSYIALMWLALEAGGALGVVAVRLADSLPAFFFGLHGGIAADRWSRRRLMIGADLVRAAMLIPVAIAGLAGSTAAVGARRRGVRARGRDELLRAGLRRDDPGRRRPRERAAGERARPRDGAGALGRRLGGRGAAAPVRPGEHVLRGRRGDVPRLGRAAHAPGRRPRARRRGRVDAAARGHRRAAPAPRALARGDRVRDRDDDHDRLRGSPACRRSCATRSTTGRPASRS